MKNLDNVSTYWWIRSVNNGYGNNLSGSVDDEEDIILDYYKFDYGIIPMFII